MRAIKVEPIIFVLALNVNTSKNKLNVKEKDNPSQSKEANWFPH